MSFKKPIIAFSGSLISDDGLMRFSCVLVLTQRVSAKLSDFWLIFVANLLAKLGFLTILASAPDCSNSEMILDNCLTNCVKSHTVS